MLSPFSCVRLCTTPQMAAHQAPPSLGFSRQEHWSGLPFPSPMHESESEVAQSCPTLSDLMDCSLTGSSVHGIFQARVLEWGAIAFSVEYHVAKLLWLCGQIIMVMLINSQLKINNIVVQSLSCVPLFVTPCIGTHQAFLSLTISRVCSNSCPLSR